MNTTATNHVEILHNRAAERIRLRVPIIKHRPTIAELLKHHLLKNPDAEGIYHAEPNAVTGTLLIKYHPALRTEREIVELVEALASKIGEGAVPITAKHRNPRVSRMMPGAYFSRELIVSVAGNVLAGLVLAAFLTR
jgi:hypothetical protein